MKFYVTDDNLPPFRFDFSISIIDRKFYIIYTLANFYEIKNRLYSIPNSIETTKNPICQSWISRVEIKLGKLGKIRGSTLNNP